MMLNGTTFGVSKFADMKKRLVILIVAGVVLISITDVITSEGPPSIPSQVAPVLIAANDPTQPANFSGQGFYIAKPYYIMVLVPGPVYPRMMVAPHDATMPCKKPELRLEKR